MKKDSFEQRILTADEGKYLYNEKEKTFGNVVYLGREADESEWVEITEQEKKRLEAEWAVIPE